MKKIFLLLILLFAFVSCTEDVVMNGSSMKALKDGILWRPVAVTATVATNGSLSIEALLQNQSLTIDISSTTPATYIFGVNDTNKVNYFYTEEGANRNYVTGTGIGNGNITITEYDVENKTITGTFKLNADSEIVNPNVPKIVNFSQGGFYKIPLTPAL